MTTLPTAATAALARLVFLDGTPGDVLARFAAQARWVNAAPGQAVMDYDDTAKDVFFVVQGEVRVLVRTGDGERTLILGDFGAGDLVGEMSAIDGAPRSARVEALVRTRLCIVPAAAFLDLVAGSPSVGLRLLRRLAARVRGQNRLLLERSALPTGLRLAAELLRLARARPDGSASISPPPTQEELAERIGARRETVSRELSALARAGLLHRTRPALVLDDPAALGRLVDAVFDPAD